jgi:Flp pilus assembly protein TadB
VYRIIQKILDENHPQSIAITKNNHWIITINLCFIAIRYFAGPYSLWSLQIIEILLLYNLDSLFEYYLKRQFPQKIKSFVDEMVLMMMLGRSFRDSFHYICQKDGTIFSLKMLDLLKSIQLSVLNRDEKISDPSILEFLERIKHIDQSPHNAIVKLKAYQKSLQTEIYIKKKLKQATVSAKSQGLIMTSIYIGLLCFVLEQNNLSKIGSWVFLSLILYLSGLILSYLLSRRRKWKT